MAFLDDSDENIKHSFIGRLAYELNLFLPRISVLLKQVVWTLPPLPTTATPPR